jgi:hypothetical protein
MVAFLGFQPKASSLASVAVGWSIRAEPGIRVLSVSVILPGVYAFLSQSPSIDTHLQKRVQNRRIGVGERNIATSLICQREESTCLIVSSDKWRFAVKRGE